MSKAVRLSPTPSIKRRCRNHDRRKVYALGLCRACYDKTRRDKTRVYARTRYKKNRRHINEWQREYYKKHKRSELALLQQVLNRYGLKVADYEWLLERQNDRCALCHEKPKGGRLYVDHDHTTNKVRGLLCPRCNMGLGAFKDHPELLRAAIVYLDQGGGPTVPSKLYDSIKKESK